METGTELQERCNKYNSGEHETPFKPFFTTGEASGDHVPRSGVTQSLSIFDAEVIVSSGLGGGDLQLVRGGGRPQLGHRLLGQVAPFGYEPLVVLFDADGGDQPER